MALLLSVCWCNTNQGYENNKQKRAKEITTDEKTMGHQGCYFRMKNKRTGMTVRRVVGEEKMSQKPAGIRGEEFGRSSAAGWRGEEKPRGTRTVEEERSETAGIKREEV